MDVRQPTSDELEGICEFGAAYIPEHYGPMLGPDAAQAQVDDCWTRERMLRAVEEGRVVVAIEEGDVVGVGEWSLYNRNPVIWKLYVHRRIGVKASVHGSSRQSSMTFRTA